MPSVSCFEASLDNIDIDYGGEDGDDGEVCEDWASCALDLWVGGADILVIWSSVPEQTEAPAPGCFGGTPGHWGPSGPGHQL
jgi:hypothetical protein